mmetsp:Transcript_87139/g.154252  ORF Transcript_87139/g.154252 Transcript_87139/m.154252 type:complete len:210 (-) Transcript_87139:207-836(-)
MSLPGLDRNLCLQTVANRSGFVINGSCQHEATRCRQRLGLVGHECNHVGPVACRFLSFDFYIMLIIYDQTSPHCKAREILGIVCRFRWDVESHGPVDPSWGGPRTQKVKVLQDLRVCQEDQAVVLPPQAKWPQCARLGLPSALHPSQSRTSFYPVIDIPHGSYASLRPSGDHHTARLSCYDGVSLHEALGGVLNDRLDSFLRGNASDEL